MLHYWFHILGPADWYRRDEAIDVELRRRFAWEWGALRHLPARHFLTDPDTALGAVLLFDQVPRNIHRGAGEAFASDSLARAISKKALRLGWDDAIAPEQRQFLAMPLMHSETMADQRMSLAYFAKNLPRNLSFARSHLRMIAKFGRYPHRNIVLGRTSSPAEVKAVEAGNSW